MSQDKQTISSTGRGALTLLRVDTRALHTSWTSCGPELSPRCQAAHRTCSKPSAFTHSVWLSTGAPLYPPAPCHAVIRTAPPMLELEFPKGALSRHATGCAHNECKQGCHAPGQDLVQCICHSCICWDLLPQSLSPGMENAFQQLHKLLGKVQTCVPHGDNLCS